jgi:hypothetical protein
MFVLLATGCGRVEAVPEPPGAEVAVSQFLEALKRRDWEHAYAVVHPESKKRCDAKRFATLAEQYFRNLGFAPDEVHLRSCQEHGEEAVSHIVWTGHDQGQARSYKDGFTLRRIADGWAVVLARSFGQVSTKP